MAGGVAIAGPAPDCPRVIDDIPVRAGLAAAYTNTPVWLTLATVAIDTSGVDVATDDRTGRAFEYSNTPVWLTPEATSNSASGPTATAPVNWAFPAIAGNVPDSSTVIII